MRPGCGRTSESPWVHGRLLSLLRNDDLQIVEGQRPLVPRFKRSRTATTFLLSNGLRARGGVLKQSIGKRSVLGIVFVLSVAYHCMRSYARRSSGRGRPPTPSESTHAIDAVLSSSRPSWKPVAPAGTRPVRRLPRRESRSPASQVARLVETRCGRCRACRPTARPSRSRLAEEAVVERPARPARTGARRRSGRPTASVGAVMRVLADAVAVLVIVDRHLAGFLNDRCTLPVGTPAGAASRRESRPSRGRAARHGRTRSRRRSGCARDRRAP